MHNYWVDFDPNQAKIAIDIAQAYLALRDVQARLRHYHGGIHWKKIGSGEYLYRTFDGSGAARSLGPRSPDTEAIFAQFRSGKTTCSERQSTLRRQIEDLARLGRAVRINRVPAVVTAIVRVLEQSDLPPLTVLGTNALYAYEAMAGGTFATHLLATGDVDFLLDARQKLRVAMPVEGSPEPVSVLSMLRRADSTFQPLANQPFRAANARGYLVDLVTAPGALHSPTAAAISPGDLVPAEIHGLQWLLSSPRVTATVIGTDGIPAQMLAPDPRAFAIYKLWMSGQPDREPIKKRRDELQALAVASVVRRRLPQFPFDEASLQAFPGAIVASCWSRLVEQPLPPEEHLATGVPGW